MDAADDLNEFFEWLEEHPPARSVDGPAADRAGEAAAAPGHGSTIDAIS